MSMVSGETRGDAPANATLLVLARGVAVADMVVKVKSKTALVGFTALAELKRNDVSSHAHDVSNMVGSHCTSIYVVLL